jgi:N-acetylmuramoyl-L-alanine amidase
MRRILIPLVALTAWPTAAEDMLRVTAVRCWSLSEATRVIIEVNGEFTFHSERAHDPERIFFDVENARPLIEGRRLYSSNVTDPLIQRIRVAETTPGVTRVVLDLTGPGEYSANQLSNPDRLVIELRPKGGKTIPPVAPPPAVTQAAPQLPSSAALVPVPVPAPTNVPSRPVTAEPTPAPTTSPSHPLTAAPVSAPAPPLSRDDSGRAARPTSDGANSMTRALGLKIRRVVIDPGHGGHDDGTIGPSGLTEKELVLDVALRLGKLIESRMGSEVIYTRSDDTFIPLHGRTELANDKKADLFLSIHANSSSYPRIGGVETYYLNFTDSKDSLAVAARENATSDKSVFELHDLLQKITLQDKAEESKEFAARMQAALFAFAVRYNPGIKNRGVKKAPFVVLIGASMPSVLVEIGFLTNSREEGLLRKPEHRQKLAEALYRGVNRYSDSLSHFQMARAAGQASN